MLRKIDRLIIRVPSLESAVRYYQGVLGLKLLRQERQLASFVLGDGATELILHTDPDLPADAMYYLVDNVRALYKNRSSLKLSFVGPPTPVARGFRATVKDPFGTVLLLIDRTTDPGGHPTHVEDAKVPTGLFAGIENRAVVKRDKLIKAYEHVGLTANDLPYTPHFEAVYTDYAAHFGETKPSRQEVWRHLLNLRKGGKLPKMGEARSTPPPITPEARELLKRMLGDDIGKRDRLPYTLRFDTLVDEFNKSQTRPLSPHLVWRLVATLAK